MAGLKGGPGSVTLRDVANRAGVSATTVSRILNGRDMGVPIREETRARVLTLAAELGYKPNLLARGLRGSRSSLLGVIARDISDPFHIQILRGIDAISRARDYRMFLGHVDYRPDVALSYGSMFERSHADGIIVIGDIEGSADALDVLAGQHQYLAGVTDRTDRSDHPQTPGVYSDSAVGMELALTHLVELGHRSVVCVSDARTHDGRFRMDQYERSMRRRDLGAHVRMYVTDQEPAPSFELGQRIFAEAGERDRPTAILATSDTTAIGLMQAAYQAGLSIPRDLSIVGYDDIDIAPFTIPPLTTISQSGVDMGRAAANMLMDMIEQQRDRAGVADLVLEPRLVVRESTGPPARHGPARRVAAPRR
jgi:LacI family transcriptional regulator